ncbi:MAG: hypothetical protein RL220_604 [Bacteroidota bacterium]
MSAQSLSIPHIRWESYHALLEAEHLVGRTPLHAVGERFTRNNSRILAKLEWQQLGGSVKARAAFNILRKSIERGDLREGMRVLDASSGNTALAYAVFCALARIPLTLCVPANIAAGKRHKLTQLGAELIFTSPLEGTDGAQEEALRLNLASPGKYYYADQYNNAANWQAHYHTTAAEIWEQTDGTITHFVAGLGTSGTFTGTASGLRELSTDIVLVSCQPDSPMHGLEGWKHMETAKVPGIYNVNLAHRELWIPTQEALDLIPEIRRYEGLELSPSAAANLLAAMRLAEENEGAVIVTVFADERKSEHLKEE